MKAIDGTLLTDAEYDLLLSLSDEGIIEPGKILERNGPKIIGVFCTQPSYAGSWFEVSDEAELKAVEMLLRKGLAILDEYDYAFALTESGVVLAKAIIQREMSQPMGDRT